MLSVMLSTAYLGAVLCYVASPVSTAGKRERSTDATQRLRYGGWGLLGLSFVLGLAVFPVAAGVIVWLSMVATALSVLVIAGPLANWFVALSSAVALILVVVAPWV